MQKVILGVLGAMLGGIVILGGILFFQYVSYHDMGNRMEKQIQARWEDNENVLSSYYLKVEDMVQVNEMYKDDLREIVTAAIQGRYGDDGSQATWQWIQEQNPNLDPSIYQKLQQTMEAGRNEFKMAQTKLVDVKRAYETQLDNLWSGFMLNLAGYPEINLNDYQIISTQQARNAFETGMDQGVTLRGDG